VSKLYGVKCKTCDDFIKLGNREEGGGKEITFYAAPLGPIQCSCGSSHEYKSDELVDENGAPVK
jgi:hypothetical protein